MDIDSIRKAQAKLDADRDALISKHMRAPIGIHTLKDLRGRGKNLENCIPPMEGNGVGLPFLPYPPLNKISPTQDFSIGVTS